MQVFSRFQKDLPAITLATAAASFAYSSGFFLSIDTDVVKTPPYGDVLGSTIYLFPFVILLYISGNGVLKYTQNDFDFGNKRHVALLVSLFIVGFFLLIIGRKESVEFPVTILFLSSSPFIIRVSYRIFDKTERQTIVQFVSMIFVLTVVFFHGYSDFHGSISPRNHTYVIADDCDRCRLVKIYSNFIILDEGSDKPLKFRPNDWHFSFDRTGASQADVR